MIRHELKKSIRSARKSEGETPAERQTSNLFERHRQGYTTLTTRMVCNLCNVATSSKKNQKRFQFRNVELAVPVFILTENKQFLVKNVERYIIVL